MILDDMIRAIELSVPYGGDDFIHGYSAMRLIAVRLIGEASAKVQALADELEQYRALGSLADLQLVEKSTAGVPLDDDDLKFEGMD